MILGQGLYPACLVQWAGQLGDGRAINLGEALGADGSTWEVQLKVRGDTQDHVLADKRGLSMSAKKRAGVGFFAC